MFLKTSLLASCSLLRFEDRVTLDVNPVGCLRRDVAAKAVFFKVSCDLVIGGVGLEKCPSPSIPPQRIAGMASFFVFDHHEPHFRSRGPMYVPGRHFPVICCIDFFNQDGSLSKLPVFAVVLSRARRCVCVVQLSVTVEIDD